MKAAAWLTGLCVCVLAALWMVSPVEQMRRQAQPGARAASSPETDGYAPGHRAVWATDAPLETLLAPADRRVEVVSRGPVTSADIAWLLGKAPRPSPLDTAPRRAPLVLVLTVTDLESAPVDSADARIGRSPQFETRRVFARVDEVIKNRSPHPVLAGTSIVFSYSGGGETTINGTHVVTRFDGERLPQRGRKYLWFLSATREEIFGGSAANVFAAGGRHITPLARNKRFARLRPEPTADALARVRRLTTLPDLFEYESASGIVRDPLVFERVAAR